MGYYTCVYKPLMDVIMESAPEYKQYDLYIYDPIYDGYTWAGNIADVYEHYELEMVDWIDEDKKCLALVYRSGRPEI